MRKKKSFEVTDPYFQERLLFWSGKHEVACVLNSNHDTQLFSDPYSTQDIIVAVGAIDQLLNPEPNNQNSFDLLKDFYESKKDWLFGFFTYDLKNDSGRPGEKLKSENNDEHGFPIVHFFQPRLIVIHNKEHSIMEILFLEKYDSASSVQQIFDEISETTIPDADVHEVTIQHRVSKKEYVSTVSQIKEHIQRGDIYEMNYCMEYFSAGSPIHPVHAYQRLNAISPMPFSCFYKLQDHYLMCASPERFVAKRKSAIISQPMKGTARRGKNREDDEVLRQWLNKDPKERSENVMIVDLVRNDLSRTAKKGSVQVNELFGVYAFQQLHQMISTVVSEMKDEIHFTEVIKNLFPMGSMTGAPKIRAMQLIEQFEKTKRGLYSGSVGYISPEGDFDFNVVIRSILYHQKKKYLSFMVGSAITANSVVEKEYDECLLKATAMLQALTFLKEVVING